MRPFTISAAVLAMVLCACTEPTEPAEPEPTFDDAGLPGTWITTAFTTGSGENQVDRLARGGWMNLVIEGDSTVSGTLEKVAPDGGETSIGFSGRWRPEGAGLVFELPALPQLDDLVFLRSDHALEAAGVVHGEPAAVRMERWTHWGRWWHPCPDSTSPRAGGLEVVVDSANSRWTFYTFRNLSDEDIPLMHRGERGQVGPITVRYLWEDGEWIPLDFGIVNSYVAWITLKPGDCGKALASGGYEGPGRYRLGVLRRSSDFTFSEPFDLN